MKIQSINVSYCNTEIILVSLEVEQLKRNLEDTQQKLAENEILLNTSNDKSSNVEAENANLKRSLEEIKSTRGQNRTKTLFSDIEQLVYQVQCTVYTLCLLLIQLPAECIGHVTWKARETRI